MNAKRVFVGVVTVWGFACSFWSSGKHWLRAAGADGFLWLLRVQKWRFKAGLPTRQGFPCPLVLGPKPMKICSFSDPEPRTLNRT